MEHVILNPLDAAILARAEAQWGLVRRDQLLALGLGLGGLRHRKRNGRLLELHPGIYALGHTALPRRADYLAAVWWCGGDATLAQESATAFHRWTVEDEEHPPPVHVVTTAQKSSRPGVVVHRTRRLPPADVLTFHRLLRVTDHARTLIDRADHLPYGELRLLADQLRSLPKAELERKHARLPGRAGHRRTELLIHSEDAKARSELERRWTAYAHHHDLPQPDDRNAMVGAHQVDVVYRDPRLALELDSRAHHQRVAEMLADKRRDRAYREVGWIPIRVMWEELEPGDSAVARELRRYLGTS